MFLYFKKTAVLLVCVAPVLLAGSGAHGPDARNSCRRPDPFAQYSRLRPQRPVSAKLAGLHGGRAVWADHDRAKSFAFLLAASLCLVMLEMKILRRSTGREERLATRLAGALRSGALEFDGGARTVSALLHDRIEEQDPDDTPAPEPEVMPTRYGLLAYGGSVSNPMKPEEELTVKYLVAGEEFPVIPDEDLLLGIPHRLIRPDVLEPAIDILARLQITTGSADSDDPGKCVPQADLVE